MKTSAVKRWKRKQIQVNRRYSSKRTSKFKRKRNLSGKYVILLNKSKSRNAAILKFTSRSLCKVEGAVAISNSIIKQTSSRYIIVAEKHRKMLNSIEVIVKKSFREEYEGLCLKENARTKARTKKRTKRMTPVKIYSCATCNHKFTNQKMYEQHVESHTRADSSSDSEAGLVIDDDVLLVLDDDNQDQTFESNPHATLNLESDHEAEIEKFCCQMPNCKQKFDREEMLIVHIGMYHNVTYKAFKCNKCDDSFNRESGLIAHKKISHPIEIISPRTLEPAKRGRRKSTFIPTVEAVNGPQSSMGGSLPKSLINTNHLRANKEVVSFNLYDSSKKKIFVCRICSSSFEQRIFLDRHVAVHHVSKLYYCYKCNVPFEMCRLLTHLKEFHPNQEHEAGYIDTISNLENIAVHRCAFCMYSSRERTLVLEHLKAEHYDEFEKEESVEEEQASSPDSLENLLLPETVKILSAREEQLLVKTQESQQRKYPQAPRRPMNDPSFKYRCARCQRRFAKSETLRQHACRRKEVPVAISSPAQNHNPVPSKISQMRLTVKSQIKNGFFGCQLCPQVFTCREMFNHHVSTGDCKNHLKNPKRDL